MRRVPFFDEVPVFFYVFKRDRLPWAVAPEFHDIGSGNEIGLVDVYALNQEEGDATVGDDSFEVLNLLVRDIGKRERSSPVGALCLKIDIMSFINAIVVGGGLRFEIGLRDGRSFGVIDLHDVDGGRALGDEAKTLI